MKYCCDEFEKYNVSDDFYWYGIHYENNHWYIASDYEDLVITFCPFCGTKLSPPAEETKKEE